MASSKKEWRRAITLETRRCLVLLFPQAFAPFGQPKKPLKIGIFSDILAACPDLKPWALGFALKDYCEGLSYKRALAAGGARVDIHGNEVEQVSPEHMAQAAGALAQTSENSGATSQMARQSPTEPGRKIAAA